MHITRANLDDAVKQGLLSAEQGQALWAFWQQQQQATPSFKPAHILYYLGGLIAIGAMSLFMTLGWEQFGGTGLMLIALAYGAVLVGLTEVLLRKRQLAIPAGITATLAVVLVPLAVYGAQNALGLWPDDGPQDGSYRDYHRFIDWRWLLMELATLAAGAVALWRYRLPFLVMPIAVTLWYLSMDFTPFVLGTDHVEVFSDARKWVSVGFGLLMLGLAFWVDVRSKSSRDFAFWLYLFGVLAFWGGLSSLHSDSAWSKLVYLCINLALIAKGAMLSRRVLAVFGALGVAGYLGYLSHDVFKDSLLFPVALSAIGLGVVAAGIGWQRHEDALGNVLRRWMPTPLRELVERRAGQ